MIVFPMAGLSRRFSEAGYDKPKFMLPLGDGFVFDCAVGGFSAYFDDQTFLFVCREEAGVERFLRDRLDALGVRKALVVSLDAPTLGQADTVAKGLAAALRPAAPLTIFNIDTFRPAFRFPERAAAGPYAGYLEVFEGGGENWSFVRPATADAIDVAETAEKRPISNLCCTGLYHFAHSTDFLAAVEAAKTDAGLQGPGGEIYVAPLYNFLIARRQRVAFERIDRQAVIFCGIPAEYEAEKARLGLRAQSGGV